MVGADDETFDFVVVGAGSAGCVLAHRLSEDAGTRVLLLEAGPPDRSWQLQMPAALAYPLAGDRFVDQFESDPEPGLAGRRVGHPRGRVIGGTSSINGMMFVRGHRLDFDRWQREGCAGWSYADLLPYFRRMEHRSDGTGPYRGIGGPQRVRQGTNAGKPLNRAFIAACREAGYRETSDFNGAEQEGVGVFDQSIDGGVRWSTANAYLRPAMRRANLTVMSRATAEHVVIEGRRVTAVAALVDGQRRTFAARREIILSAGTFRSPQLLMVSGVGSADSLKAVGLDVVADRRGVGANLQDHLDAVLRFRCPLPVSLHRQVQPLGKVLAGLAWFLARRGPAATNHFDVGAFLRSGPDVDHPDLQISFLPLALAPGSVQSDQSIGTDGFQLHIDLLRPKGRGSLRLSGPTVGDRPLISFGYLAEIEDRQRLANGIQIGRRIISQPAMTPYRGEEITPGTAVGSSADLANWLTANADTAYHPVGTCRMGRAADPMNVVDPECRVIGIDGLRVVDASVMPSLVSGNTNAATIMIAERAADLIRGRSEGTGNVESQGTV